MDLCDIANLFTSKTLMKDRNISDNTLLPLTIKEEKKKIMAEYLINSSLYRHQGKLTLNDFELFNMYPVLIKRSDKVEIYEGRINKDTDRETLKALFNYCHYFFEDMQIFDTIPEQIVTKGISEEDESENESEQILTKSRFKDKFETDSKDESESESEEDKIRTKFNKEILKLPKLYNAELKKTFVNLDEKAKKENISDEDLAKQKLKVQQKLEKKYNDMKKNLRKKKKAELEELGKAELEREGKFKELEKKVKAELKEQGKS